MDNNSLICGLTDQQSESLSIEKDQSSNTEEIGIIDQGNGMPDGYLSQKNRDHITSASLVGSICTFIALIVAIYQLRKVKNVSEAATEAAKEVAIKSKTEYRQYVVSNASRFIGEARLMVRAEDWERASTRVGDVADQLAQLANTDESLNELQILSTELRDWVNTFQRVADSDIKFNTSSKKKWLEFNTELSKFLDEHTGPYRKER